MPDFQHGLFGCMGDVKSCVCTILIPCYVEGKVAEKVNESCLLHSIFTMVPILNLVCIYNIRQKVRTHRAIPGSLVMDLLSVIFCAPCVICQESQEVGALGEAMARE